MGRSSSRQRWFRLLLTGLLIIASTCSASLQQQPIQRTQSSQDIVVAGGIDGRVYAINAWTGDVLWMFDSGGPMVDSSDCGAVKHETPQHSTTSQRVQPRNQATTIDVDGDVRTGNDGDRSLQPKSHAANSDAIVRTSAGDLVGLSQMIPSYDGRLYHIDGSNVRELDMNMVDIINANGPVRLTSATEASPSPENDADLLLFGEKETKIFSLDATQGLVTPYLSPSSSSSPTILFGRAEFKTKAVHARNMSAARCFTISEYFLQFAEQSKCSMSSTERAGSPEIIVLPKDPDSTNPDDEESTIAAYDPWSHKQLWELQIPRFDVISVFGVSAGRGSSFFRWSVEGPSSSGTSRKNGLVVSKNKPAATQQPERHTSQTREITAGVVNEPINDSKQLVKALPREWSSVESQYRLRLLDGNYYLEQHEDEEDNTASDASFYGGEVRPKKKRRVFWESMESDGKKGVFITYYHVGAMTLGMMVGCILIAWGFYVKGLSASGVIKSLDHQFLPSGHIHQLTIERPGQETITISSSITRSLLMDAAASFGFASSTALPMIDNGDETYSGSAVSSSSRTQLDPETEAMLLEKFSKMLALEAASALAGPRFSKNTVMQLESDPDSSTASTTRTSSTLTLLSDTSSQNRRLSIMESDSLEDYAITELGNTRNVTEDNEGRIVPVIEEIDCSSSESLTDAKLFCDSTADSVENDVGGDMSASSVESEAKSGSSWSSDGTGSSDDDGSCEDDSQEASQSCQVENADEDESTSDSVSTKDVSNPRKTSNASSASSSANEQEVLFPFVCQSRFANEFVELSALGKGGFGQVVLAENRLDGRKYAIKRVGLHLKHQTSKTLQKFLREVKILALLDHPNIVRYYQAWLEKVEEGTLTHVGLSSDGLSDVTGTAPPRNYSMSNLLAPISEMEYSNQHKSLPSFYSNGSFGDNDGGFEWERDSADGEGDDDVWHEEDLETSSTKHGTKRQQIIEPNKPAKAAGARRAEVDESASTSAERCDHWLYIQMQYCAGRTLADYLAIPTRSMEPSKLFKIFTQIASAIAHVHSCGLIHRDLKPANIFVADTDGDSIKLGDFGLSRYAANVNLTTTTSQTTTVEETSTSSVFMNGGGYSVSKWSMSISHMSESQDITAGVGTYLYASPEQVAGKKYNAKTDMYSLGMILFELCHERFGTTMERYVTLRNARDCKYPPEFEWRKKSPEIMEMLDRLLHRDPMERPDAAEVVQWSQEMYEVSLARNHAASHKMSMRSPIHQSRSFHTPMPSLNLDHVGGVDLLASTFSLQVEAGDGAADEDSADHHLPNHDLLKDVFVAVAKVADVSGGRMEIKKYGVHLQDGGGQVLDFVVDAHVPQDVKGDKERDEIILAITRQQNELAVVIRALRGVRSVRFGA